MQPIKIGKWIITEDGIHHQDNPDPNYLVSVSTLNEGGPEERANMYDWMVHLPTKSWVSIEDVYSFNTALIYALEYFGIGFTPDRSFVDTITLQQEILATKRS